MAQRKKRPAVRKGKLITRRKARKPSKSARKRPAKRTAARATPSKRLAKTKLKRGEKKPRKKVRAVKPRSTPAVETVVVDAVEEPVPGVAVVAEVEDTEVVPEQPEERRATPGIRRIIRIVIEGTHGLTGETDRLRLA
jgi:hypothetical protein